MAKDTALHMAECIEDFLKFLRVSLSAGPISMNPRTETYHLIRLKQALEAYRAAQETKAVLVTSELTCPATDRCPEYPDCECGDRNSQNREVAR